MTRNLRAGEAPLELPEGVRARDFYAKYVQEQYSEQYGRDFSGLSRVDDARLDRVLPVPEHVLLPRACSCRWCTGSGPTPTTPTSATSTC